VRARVPFSSPVRSVRGPHRRRQHAPRDMAELVMLIGYDAGEWSAPFGYGA